MRALVWNGVNDLNIETVDDPKILKAKPAADGMPRIDIDVPSFGYKSHISIDRRLFLTDVGEEDGPFAFVPGSHRLMPERLEWEHEQAQIAVNRGGHHALGSFRITEGGRAPSRPTARRPRPPSRGGSVG